ncbi:hypothetical protein JCM6882_008030 [Rhodosporidiobolus microsporus]
MLVPLGILDAQFEPVGLCCGFVFAFEPGWTADETANLVQRLKQATERVVRKWPLLAGVPKLLGPNRWAVDVPDNLELVKLLRPLYGFTSISRSEAYHTAAGLDAPLPPLSSSSSIFLPEPKLDFLRPSSLPGSLPAVAKAQLPLLHVHATSFSDALAVGVSVPHGVFDGAGTALVLRAIDAEVHGREWVVPPTLEVNPLLSSLDKLADDPTIDPAQPLPPILEGWKSAGDKLVLARLAGNLLWETFWHKSSQRYLFLRKELVDGLAAKIKEDAALADEADSDATFSVHLAYNPRSLLDKYLPAAARPLPCFDLYPHNAATPFAPSPSSPLSASDISSIPVASLALGLRRGLEAHRTLPTLQAVWRQLKDEPAGLMPDRRPPSLFPSSEPHLTRWLVTNQSKLGVTELRMPGKEEGKDLPLLAFHLCAVAPADMDHVITIQKVAGAGSIVGACMRRSRWESIETAVEAMEQELV